MSKKIKFKLIERPQPLIINTQKSEPVKHNDNECPICCDKLDDNDENNVVLKCNHKFHYDCILAAYKSKQQNTHNSRIIRSFPFCRGYGGYLELKKNMFPLRKIHKEWVKICDCFLTNDYKKIEEITKDYINTEKCHAIVKTGNNKGSQCVKSKKDGYNYCHIHKKKFNIE